MCQILWPQPHDKIQTTWKFIVLFKINRTKIRKRTLLKHQPIKKNLRLTMNKKKYSGKAKNTRIRKFLKHDTKTSSAFAVNIPDVMSEIYILFFSISTRWKELWGFISLSIAFPQILCTECELVAGMTTFLIYWSYWRICCAAFTLIIWPKNFFISFIYLLKQFIAGVIFFLTDFLGKKKKFLKSNRK